MNPVRRRLSSRTCWKASETVHRIGSTTIANTMTTVGEISSVAGAAVLAGPGGPPPLVLPVVLHRVRCLDRAPRRERIR